MELSRRTTLVSDIIALLHFADNPMQQAGSDHLVAAKLHCDVLKEGIAVGRCYRLGGLHQPVEFVRRQSQSQLVQWDHGTRSTSKNQECGNRSLVSASE